MYSKYLKMLLLSGIFNTILIQLKSRFRRDFFIFVPLFFQANEKKYRPFCAFCIAHCSVSVFCFGGE